MHTEARLVVLRLLLVFAILLKAAGCARDPAPPSLTSEASWVPSAAETDLRALVAENGLLIGSALAGAGAGLGAHLGGGNPSSVLLGAAVGVAGAALGYAVGNAVESAREARQQTEQANDIAQIIEVEHRARFAVLVEDDALATDVTILMKEKNRALNNSHFLNLILERNDKLISQIDNELNDKKLSYIDGMEMVRARRALAEQNDQLKDQFGEIVEIVSIIDEQLVEVGA